MPEKNYANFGKIAKNHAKMGPRATVQAPNSEKSSRGEFLGLDPWLVRISRKSVTPNATCVVDLVHFLVQPLLICCKWANISDGCCSRLPYARNLRASHEWRVSQLLPCLLPTWWHAQILPWIHQPRDRQVWLHFLAWWHNLFSIGYE